MKELRDMTAYEVVCDMELTVNDMEVHSLVLNALRDYISHQNDEQRHDIGVLAVNREVGYFSDSVYSLRLSYEHLRKRMREERQHQGNSSLAEYSVELRPPVHRRQWFAGGLVYSDVVQTPVILDFEPEP